MLMELLISILIFSINLFWIFFWYNLYFKANTLDNMTRNIQSITNTTSNSTLLTSKDDSWNIYQNEAYSEFQTNHFNELNLNMNNFIVYRVTKFDWLSKEYHVLWQDKTWKGCYWILRDSIPPDDRARLFKCYNTNKIHIKEVSWKKGVYVVEMDYNKQKTIIPVMFNQVDENNSY